MKSSTIHAAFAIGIALTPLSGVAGENLPVPNAVFQYLDEADFECSKEQPLRGMIVSPVVPLENWSAYPRVASRKYVRVHHGEDITRVEIDSKSADYENRIEPKPIDDAALTIEYSAQVCVGFLGTTVVGGTWSISGETEKHKFAGKGDFPGPGVQTIFMWRASDVEFISREIGYSYKGHFSRDIEAKISLNEIDVRVVEKTSFHRKFEERFSGRLQQSIEFQTDKPLSNDNTNPPNTTSPIRKE